MNSECLHVSDRVLIPNHCLVQAVPVNIDSGCAHIIIPYLVPVGNRTVYIRIVIITVILVICKLFIIVRIITRTLQV